MADFCCGLRRGNPLAANRFADFVLQRTQKLVEFLRLCPERGLPSKQVAHSNWPTPTSSSAPFTTAVRSVNTQPELSWFSLCSSRSEVLAELLGALGTSTSPVSVMFSQSISGSLATPPCTSASLPRVAWRGSRPTLGQLHSSRPGSDCDTEMCPNSHSPSAAVFADGELSGLEVSWLRGACYLAVSGGGAALDNDRPLETVSISVRTFVKTAAGRPGRNGKEGNTIGHEPAVPVACHVNYRTGNQSQSVVPSRPEAAFAECESLCVCVKGTARDHHDRERGTLQEKMFGEIEPSEFVRFRNSSANANRCWKLE